MSLSLHLNPDTFSALKSRNFRIFLIAQSVALTGLWIQKLANSWLVYRLTGSAFKLGLIELAGNAPIFVLGLFAGAWLEKHDIRKTMIATQTLTLINALVIAIMIYTNTIHFWYMFVLSFFLGCVNAVDLPARQSSILLMVEKKSHLKSALAIHSVVFNLSRLIGPAIAGFVIHYTNEMFCYLATSICYIPVIIVLFVIRFRDLPISTSKSSPISGAIEGLRYVKNSFPLRSVFMFIAMFALFSYSYAVLFPIFAKDLLGGGPRLLGMLLGGIGLGAIVGAFSIASIVKFRQLPKAICIFSFIYAAFIALFAISSNSLLSVLLTIPAGFGLIATFVGTNTLLQSVADDDKRSRVVSLYTMCNIGLGPVGAFLAGSAADTIGARVTLVICGLIMLIAGLILWKKATRVTSELEPAFIKLENP